MTSDSSPIQAAVVTGGHSFEVPAFHQLFRGLDGVASENTGFREVVRRGVHWVARRI